jgi:16S rRNA (guanine1207-N2)-methyltransferase
LKPRGKILAATDNSRDHWLHDRIIEAFGAATIHLRSKHGMAYIARKRPDHAPRDRDVRREFQTTLFGQTLELESRPGVFAHGKLDDGTLALSEVAEIEETSRVIDMGCGTGALGIAAALACPRGLAVLADSSARAVHCAIANARRNAAERNALVVLTHDFSGLRSHSLDAALANPPYFGDFRIAEHFTREALRILVPGGRFWLVTKAPERPLEIARGLFGAAELTERRGYAIIGARKRG